MIQRVFHMIWMLVILITLPSPAVARQDGPPEPPVLPTSVPTLPPMLPQIDKKLESDQRLHPAGASLSPEALGQPGLSFRYQGDIGVSEVPYLVDNTHLNRPEGLYLDRNGNLWVAESMGHRLLRIGPSGGVTLTLGTAGSFYYTDSDLRNPRDMAEDLAGNLWVADQNRLQQFNPTGAYLSQFPADGDPGDDETHFNAVYGIDFDHSGRMFVSDSNNHRIQVYELSGGTPVYSTTIGVTGAPSSDNFHFNFPRRIAIDSADHLYVVDQNNNRVQRCTYLVDWSCTTFASGLNRPRGITVDSFDSVFIADTWNGRIVKCTSGGACSTFVYSDKGWADLAVDANGNVYGSTSWWDTIAHYDSNGNSLGIYWGVELVPYLTDLQHFHHPHATLDNQGNLIIVEELGMRVIKRSPGGATLWVKGVAGVDADDPDHFIFPRGAAVDAQDNIYVANETNVKIHRPNGDFLAVLGAGYGTGDYQFGWVAGVAVDQADGTIYVADADNHRVQVYNSARNYMDSIGVTGAAGSDNTHFNTPMGLAVDLQGNLYVADYGNCRVQKFNHARQYQKTFGMSGSCGDSFSQVDADSLAVDAQGGVYVGGWDNRVQVFDATGAYLTTLLGRSGGGAAQSRYVCSLAVSSAGELYVGDCRNHRIQKFVRSVPGWRQMNINGFGQRYATDISSLVVHNGLLYSGISVWDGAGSQIWRSADTHNWTQVMMNGFSDPYNQAVIEMQAFQGRLYAGTYNWDASTQESHGGQLWRCQLCNNSDWSQVVLDGLDPRNDTFRALYEFGNHLYAGTSSYTNTYGAELWRSATGNSHDWTRLVANGFGESNNMAIMDLLAYQGQLYASVFNQNSGGQVWRSPNGDAGSWTKVANGGLGDDRANTPTTLKEFNGSLYLAFAHKAGGGVQVWRCSICDGSDWVKVVDNGFGNADLRYTPGLAVLDGSIYLFAGDYASGEEVWSSSDGTSWTPTAPKGFGDPNSTLVYFHNGLVVFNDRLLAGVNNPYSAAKVWMLLHKKVLLPTVLRK
jgi:sugar lactone lactonase YvrE